MALDGVSHLLVSAFRVSLFAHDKSRETWLASASLGRLHPVPAAMARFASAVLLAAALLMAGRLTHAGPSTTAEEVFWRALLPGSAVPDAVLQLLRPATTTSPTKRPASQGVPASGGARDDDHSFDGYEFSYDAPSERSDRATTRGGGAATPTPTAPTAVFFHEEAVRVGERLPLHFRAAAPAALGLLPRGVADSIPFTTAALPAVLALLGVPPGSSRAVAMAETLRTCERPPPVAGEAEETRFCATSLEAMVERAVAALGTRDVRAVTSALPLAGLPPQAYTVRAVRRIGGGASFVACHDEAYPYTVYWCHGTGPARVYLVEMEGARGGGAVTVAFVCHTDTSRWNPEHVSFKVLGTKPGGAPVCHLMPYGHIIWAKNVKPSPA